MADPRKTENCAICGQKLVYLKTGGPITCTHCGTTTEGHVKCPGGHYICNRCHGSEAITVIEETVLGTHETSPVSIAELLMAHPSLPMLGCEHAYIAAGSILAALKNSRYGKITGQEIREAFTRISRQAVGGYCGLTGVCGIVPAIGACFSVILDCRCGADMEQKIVMETAIKAAQAIADLTGPSCCKAYVRSALSAAVDVLAERFGIALSRGKPEIICRHSERHPHGCREEKCPYYRRKSRDIFADSIHLPVMSCRS
jgi:hypothetical protein